MNDKPAYMSEPWFALLAAYAAEHGGRRTAAALQVSHGLVFQVLGGSGHYGTGKASTKRFSERVLHRIGSYECPHLTTWSGRSRVITSDECRRYAHRPLPTSSPTALEHWKACRTCPHLAASAPAPVRPPVSRKPRPAEAGNTTPAKEAS